MYIKCVFVNFTFFSHFFSMITWIEFFVSLFISFYISNKCLNFSLMCVIFIKVLSSYDSFQLDRVRKKNVNMWKRSFLSHNSLPPMILTHQICTISSKIWAKKMNFTYLICCWLLGEFYSMQFTGFWFHTAG